MFAVRGGPRAGVRNFKMESNRKSRIRETKRDRIIEKDKPTDGIVELCVPQSPLSLV